MSTMLCYLKKLFSLCVIILILEKSCVGRGAEAALAPLCRKTDKIHRKNESEIFEDILRHIENMPPEMKQMSSFDEEDLIDDSLVSLRLNHEPFKNFRKLPGIRCEPLLTPIPFTRPDSNPDGYYYPAYAAVHRCGGCCNHPLLTCEIDGTEEVQFATQQVTFPSAGIMSLENKKEDIFPMVNHTSCKCDCKIKKEDCDRDLHYYDEDSCNCICGNHDEYRICLMEKVVYDRFEDREPCEEDNVRVWNPKTCSCECLITWQSCYVPRFNVKKLNQQQIDSLLVEYYTNN